MYAINRKKLLFALLLGKALVLLGLMCCYLLRLAPDEAQYWTWSQALDWGYYSKPPGIAWQIALTTGLFGNQEWAIRFGALIIGFALPWVLFSTALKLKLSEKAAFWAALIIALSPLGFFLSFAATTDGGATLFFTLALCTAARGIENPKGPSYGWVGFFVLCGALYKWVAFGAWFFVLIGLLFFPPLRKKSVVGGILFSLLALVPTLYWNANHEWATFRHVGATIAPTTSHGNVGDFLAAQMGLLSPIFFFILCFSCIAMYRKENRSKQALLFCAIVTSFVAVYLIASMGKKIQPNWAAYLYPIGGIVAAYWAVDKHPKGVRWLHIGVWASVIFLAFALFIPQIHAKNLFSLSYKSNPFRQNLGWDRLGTILQQVGYKPEKDFLFGDKYQTASLLSYYGSGKKRAYFFNLNQQRKNQFSYWPSLGKTDMGKTGYFVILENCTQEACAWYESYEKNRLSPYFTRVEYLGAYPLFEANGVAVKHALIFRGDGFNGIVPSDPSIY